MNNPFEHLKKQREEREEKERQAKQIAEQAAKELWAIYKKYGEIVRPVLEQLREAEYPNDRVGYSDGKDWDIGTDKTYDGGTVDAGRRSEVTVKLKFRDNLPVAFICECPSKAAGQVLETGLSREELAQALIKLHSPAKQSMVKKNWSEKLFGK